MTAAQRTPATWARSVRAHAAAALAGTPLDPATLSTDPERARHAIATFADERGHRRAVDGPLLSAVLGLAWTGGAPTRPPGGARSAAALWHRVHADAVGDGAGDAGIDVLPGEGPLLNVSPEVSVEVWTEEELSALHALWWIARRTPAWRARVRSAARWHTAELQPDNATNHPWALHVFVELGHDAGEGDDVRSSAMLHAQTLLHNCVVSMGRPDRFSAFVLLDAARGLDAMSHAV